MATTPSQVDSLQKQLGATEWLHLFGVEDRLLIACARQRLTDANTEALGVLLQESIDWAQVIHRARWHRLAGMLYYHLRNPEYSQRVPDQILDQLKGDYRRITAQFLYTRSELGAILMAFEAKTIPVIVLKGAGLVGSVYTEPGMRPMSDIDLLVPDHRVVEAQSTVQCLGYSAVEDASNREGHWSLHQHLPKLVRTENPIVVEVHRHIVRLDSPLAFDINEFWSRARETSSGGTSAYLLAPEDLLVHLCLNFFRDRRFQSARALCQLCDIAEVIQHYRTIDWETLGKRSETYGVAGPLACSLHLARSLLDAPIPEETVRSLAPQIKERDLAEFARQRVVTARQWVASELVGPGDPYDGKTMVRAAAGRIIPTREYMRRHYGNARFGSYLRRLGQAVRLGARFVCRPSELNSELGVDRWMHSLYSGKGT
jgi:hypothetical protein